jgi:hypothetical protein
MKQFYLKSAFFSLILAGLFGCQKTYVVSKAQDILFQVEFISINGVYAHNGYFIDVNGNILTYNLPEKWNFPKEDQILSKAEVLENLASSKMTTNKIPIPELRKFINYIDNIAASKLSLPKTHTTERGTLSFYCYQYSEGSAEYKRTVIKSEGHINCENLNFFSKKVVSWLNEQEKANAK